MRVLGDDATKTTMLPCDRCIMFECVNRPYAGYCRARHMHKMPADSCRWWVDIDNGWPAAAAYYLVQARALLDGKLDVNEAIHMLELYTICEKKTRRNAETP